MTQLRHECNVYRGIPVSGSEVMLWVAASCDRRMLVISRLQEALLEVLAAAADNVDQLPGMVSLCFVDDRPT